MTSSLRHTWHIASITVKMYQKTVAHMYEENWVRFHFDDSDYLLNETLFYIKEGLADFHADDGVPISMKAILYNRFCHWG